MKTYDEPDSPHEKGKFKMHDETGSPNEGACLI